MIKAREGKLTYERIASIDENLWVKKVNMIMQNALKNSIQNLTSIHLRSMYEPRD